LTVRVWASTPSRRVSFPLTRSLVAAACGPSGRP
jgi:hypothetical protein